MEVNRTLPLPVRSQASFSFVDAILFTYSVIVLSAGPSRIREPLSSQTHRLEYRVIEINCLNNAGFYACDMGAVVKAIENM